MIINAALSEKMHCDICKAAISIFVKVLAAEAGNLALKVMATGGICIYGKEIEFLIRLFPARINRVVRRWLIQESR